MIFGLPYYQNIKQFLKGERIIYLFMLLALALRVHNFSSASIWYDESVTLKLAHQSWYDIYLNSTQDVNAPFYHFLMKVWTFVFGYSLSTMRFLSVVCSVLTVGVIFKLADKHFGRQVAILAACFISLSNVHIYYSEEARCYALLCLLSSVSLYYFLDLLNFPSKKNLILYSIISLLAIYTQLFFGLQIGLTAIILFIKYRKDVKVLVQLFLWHTLIVIIFSIWFLQTFIVGETIDITDSWIPPLSYENVLWFFRDVFNHDYLAYVYVGLFMIIIPIGLMLLKDKKEIRQKYLFVILLSVIPFLVMCLYSVFSTSVFYPRFVMFTSIPLFLSISVGLSQTMGNKALLSVLIIPFVFASMNVNVFAFRNQDWNIACRYEWAFRNDNTSTIVSPSYSDMCYIYYNMDWAYFQEYKNLWYYKEERKFIGCDDSLQYMNSKFAKSKRVVFFDASPDYDDRIIQFLRNNYDSVCAKQLYGINFYVFDKKTLEVKDSINSIRSPSPR